MTNQPRSPLLIPVHRGRPYEMGRMRAVLKADQNETAGRYSISEWWLDPNTRGPGAHVHTDDHIYYVIEGALDLMIDGQWSVLERGGYAIIPGGTSHDFANRSATKTGFISLNTPAGFEARMPDIAAALASENLELQQ